MASHKLIANLWDWFMADCYLRFIVLNTLPDKFTRLLLDQCLQAVWKGALKSITGAGLAGYTFQ